MPRIQKTHVWSLAAAILSLLALWFLLFPVAGVIAQYLSGLLGVKSIGEYAVVDAAVSFAILAVLFLSVLFVKKRHAVFVVLFCAVAMFLYWGFESEFFWKGLNPMYPAWYEVNMALNDIVAAILAILLHQRITRRSSGTAQKNAAP